MAVFTLTKKNKYYIKETGDDAICVDFVARRLKSRPKQIKISVRNKNPRRTGWTKGYYFQGGWRNKVRLSTRSESVVMNATDNYLYSAVGSHGYFWFKLEPIQNKVGK
jgi:hypothetical protein